MRNENILIVGAGISGSVLAERYASIGKKVTIMEKRDHIGGNCYDFIDKNGIRMSKYGAHLFHTNDEEVWNYIQKFSNWYKWEHKVLARVEGKAVPIPVNITTVNKLFDLTISNEQEMMKWLNSQVVSIPDPQNGKEAVIAKVGSVLYEKMFKHYTKKQWDKYPEELDASVLNRIPLRMNFDDRYFSDKYQVLPEHGYTKMFEKMLSHPNIEVKLNTDYFELASGNLKYDKIFYTGPIDRFFEARKINLPKLEYRSVNFHVETVEQEYFQENSVINYPGEEVNFTRIVEYKHFGNQKSPRTTIVKETTTDHGEPYYPVPNRRNQELYLKYKAEAEKLENIHFVGRLANYKYFNMDEAFKNALSLFKQLTRAEEMKNISRTTAK